MNYAIVEIGGSQFKVKKGDTVRADFSLEQSKKSVKLGKVLMCHFGKKIEVGNPYIKGASITCDIAEVGRAKKVVAYKYKRRNSSKFKKGHRQQQITLKVKDIHFT